MPNWCCNTLKIVPITDEARALLPEIAKRFASTEPPPELSVFQFVRPMPPELENTTAPSDSLNWYDWRLANWGTKWHESGAYISRSGPNELLVSFDTAWAPPLGVYSRLVELGFDVLATYAEQGVGFAGHWHNGEDTELSLSGSAEFDDTEDMEILVKVFAGAGLAEELLPPGLGG